jgi:RNA polymerase sigma-70 factor (ECF subfamily)
MPETTPDQALLDRWRAGDKEAARELYERYVERLLVLAGKRISERLGCRIDPEDVVQSVFRTFFGHAKEGRFVLTEQEDLCKLLTRITAHKTFRQIAYHQAAKRDFRQETAHGEEAHKYLQTLVDRGVTPEHTSLFLDELEHFLKKLRPTDRQILEMRMQGHKDVEIAAALEISDRTIRRVMERVRGLAKKDGLSDNDAASDEESD